MEIKKNLILLITHTNKRSFLFKEINEEIVNYYSSEKYPRGRLLLALVQYLQHTNMFDKISLYSTNQNPFILQNGAFGGILSMVNRSEVDIDVTPLRCSERTMEAVDFSYPFEINDFTFLTFKPEYEPHFFGIFQTFSLNVWMTLAFFFFTITLLSHFILKYKCNFDKIIFYVFSVLMKQNAIIDSSSFAENLLVYSWVIGGMILCLSHDSVFLSFLSVPPLTKIEHLSDLAEAVKNGEYDCISHITTGMLEYFQNTKRKDLKIIADNISKNSFKLKSLLSIFNSRQKDDENCLFDADRPSRPFCRKILCLRRQIFSSDFFNVCPTRFLLQGTS